MTSSLPPTASMTRAEDAARTWRTWADDLAALRGRMRLEALRTDPEVSSRLVTDALYSAGEIDRAIAVADGIAEMYRRQADRIRGIGAATSPSAAR
jgi:hypothetical protein